MSLLKHILSPFVEFENEKTKDEYVRPQRDLPAFTGETAPRPEPAAVSSQTPFVPAPSQIPPNTPVQPDHRQFFENLIEEANAKNPVFQGTDFKEFIESKIDVQAIADEATRYQTAFNVLKRTGLTKERLLSTGQEYINIIGREMNGFQSANSQQYQKEVKQKEALLQQKAAELKSFTDKIAVLNKEIGQLSQDVVQSKDKLSAVKNSFLLAGENKQQEIQSELQKIARYF